jgi:hypothetical protein
MKPAIPIPRKRGLTLLEGALVRYALEITHARPELVTKDDKGNLMPTSELGMLLSEFKTRFLAKVEKQ